MKLIAASIAALALAIFGGSVVIAQALDGSSGRTEADVVKEACTKNFSDDVEAARGCILGVFDRS